MRKIIILSIIIFTIVVKAYPQRNGIIYNTGNYELGNTAYTNSAAIDLYRTSYINMHNQFVWFHDPLPPVTLTPNTNRFKIGNGNDLMYYYFPNFYNGAKFVVSNDDDAFTSFISSTSKQSLTTLWVNHTNWTSLSGTPITNDYLYNIYSHIGWGSKGKNISIFAEIDTSLAEYTTGVMSRVSTLVSPILSGTGLNPINNTGYYADLENNQNPNAYIGNIDVNTGFECNVSNNSSTNGQQANLGFKASITNNLTALNNIGSTVNLGSNWNGTTGSNQNNTGYFAAIAGNDGAAYNYDIDVNVIGNNNTDASGGTVNGQKNFGVRAFVQGNDYSTANYGVLGIAINNNALLNCGVAGIAKNTVNEFLQQPNGSRLTEGVIGVYGCATNPNVNGYTSGSGFPIPDGVAGFFNGNIVYTDNLWTTSDEKLKEKIIPIDSALNKLLQLNPKTYYFKNKDFPGMVLPETMQYGLLAQDVAKIFPTIVGDFVCPPELDDNGKELHPATPFKAISYQAFIPLLIQSVKELNGKNISLISDKKLQDRKIDSLSLIISNFQEQLNSINTTLNKCCHNRNNTSEDVNKTDISSSIKIVTDNTLNGETILNQNVPNPFRYITNFSYQLGTGGYVELEITDQIGRVVEKLVNTIQEPGTYSIDWNSEKIKSGIYFYSLKVNGLILVKKAVKI